MTLHGKTCLVTGATSGIGEATALALAARGAAVAILCRDAERGEQTCERIRAAVPGASLRLFRADLGSQAEIRAIAREILDALPELHVLVNNAAALYVSRTETVDGIEATFAVNHLGYFLLTNLLLPRLRESAPARIVNVASDAHKFVGGIHFEDPGYEKGYGAMRVYGHSKLANILFTRELARRLEGSGVTVNCLHPGAVATGLGGNNGAWARLVMKIVGLFFRSPEQGAQTSIYLASSPEVEGVTGGYFVRCKETEPAASGRDDDAARRLWAVSEEMTGLAPSSAAAGS